MKVKTDSIWLEEKKKTYPTLETNIEVDVVIIGGGIAGISTAYFLSKSNTSVALIEKDSIGSGATGYTTAMITQYIDNNLSSLESLYGKIQGKTIWDSGKDAIDLIEKIVKSEKILCEFERVPYFIYAKKVNQRQNLIKESEAAKRLGVSLPFRDDQKLLVENLGYLTLANQAKFHPIKYLYSLSSAISKSVKIFENSEALSIEGSGPFVVKTKSGNIKAKYVVVTTYTPFNRPVELAFKKARYKSYMKVAEFPKNSLPEALYQDMNSPYHYFRVDKLKSFDRLIIGGEDHRGDIPVSETKSFNSLESYIKSTFPKLDYKIIAQWAGPIVETIDGLPYIGPLHGNKNILYSTGFSGNGMTYGTLAGKILSDLCQGKSNPYSSIFDAKRIPTFGQLLQKGKDYGSILIGGALKNTLSGK